MHWDISSFSTLLLQNHFLFWMMNISKIQWQLNKNLSRNVLSLHLVSWREIETEWKARIVKGTGIWFFNNIQIIRAFECTGLWPRLDNREFKPTLLSKSYQFKFTSFAGVQRCQGTLVNSADTRDNPCVSPEQIKQSMRLLALAQSVNRRGGHCCTINSKDRTRARRMSCSVCESQDQN